jgi:hypothetical protein
MIGAVTAGCDMAQATASVAGLIPAFAANAVKASAVA